MKSDELLTCPFCGVVPEVHYWAFEAPYKGWKAELLCDNCDDIYFSGEGRTKKEAFEALKRVWNTRYEHVGFPFTAIGSDYSGSNGDPSLRPCPCCGWPKARLFHKTQCRDRDDDLKIHIYDDSPMWGSQIERVIPALDFRHGFYYRCNRCGLRTGIVWTPWHVRTEEEIEDWDYDNKYYGFEPESDWAAPARKKAADLWNTRGEWLGDMYEDVK